MLIFVRNNNKMTQNKSNIFIGSILVLFAAIMKVVTFPHSINPIIAISLFSGVIIKDKKIAFAMPLLAMFASDLMLEVFNIAPGFYGMGQVGNYLSLLLVTVLGFSMKKINPINVIGYSFGSSLLFFFLSNTNCFLFDNFNTYGTGIQGWVNCLIAGIPFVKNGIAIDLCFSTLLFGSYVVLIKKSTSKVMAS
jgi:hypothetical protein